MQIDSERVRIDLPTGWEGEVYRTAPVPQDEGTNRAVLHAATFQLPAERGDYGGGAVEMMRTDDIFVSLFEFEPASASKVLFAAARPAHLDPEDFSPTTLQRLIPGQSGVQRFFSERGRAFCLYVVLGSHASRRALVEEVNQVLATLEVDP
jgi:hypothetical protein